MADSEVAQKKELEASLAFNPDRFFISSLGEMAHASLREQADFYLVIISFTLHEISSNSYIEFLRFIVELSLSDATAFDLFPKDISTEEEKEVKSYAISPLMKIEEVKANSGWTSKQIRLGNLQPLVMASGSHTNTFSWDYAGYGKQKGITPGTKYMLAVLQVPHGTQFVDGTISYRVNVAKRWLGVWRSAAARSASYPIRLELSGAPRFFADTTVQETSWKGKSISLPMNEEESLHGRETVVMSEISVNTLRIRIIEHPLTAHNLATIISALTDLSTKSWLVTKGRFAHLIEYTQTRNSRFAEEAQVVVSGVKYNSPFEMNLKVDLSAPSVAEALVIALDGVTQKEERLKAKELENQTRVQAIKQFNEKAELERQMALLEIEEQRLDQEKQRLEVQEKHLEIQEKRLEMQKKEILDALEIAGKMADILQLEADPAIRAVVIQTILPDLLRLQDSKGLELDLPFSLKLILTEHY